MGERGALRHAALRATRRAPGVLRIEPTSGAWPARSGLLSTAGRGAEAWRGCGGARGRSALVTEAKLVKLVGVSIRFKRDEREGTGAGLIAAGSVHRGPDCSDAARTLGPGPRAPGAAGRESRG